MIFTWSFTVNVRLAKLLRNDRKYLDTGSALRLFIWSRKFWKSKGISPFWWDSGTGEAVPLPLGVWAGGGVVGLLGVARPFCETSCCAAKEDKVAGEGTGLAASSEVGRVRVRAGIEKVRANAARDGNGEVEREPADCGDCNGEDGTASFKGKAGGLGEGVLGGGSGECPSDVSHASRAASSSRLTSGSNWLRTSCETCGGF